MMKLFCNQIQKFVDIMTARTLSNKEKKSGIQPSIVVASYTKLYKAELILEKTHIAI